MKNLLTILLLFSSLFVNAQIHIKVPAGAAPTPLDYTKYEKANKDTAYILRDAAVVHNDYYNAYPYTLTLKNGVKLLFYAKGFSNHIGEYSPALRRSFDNGLTWSDEIRIQPDSNLKYTNQYAIENGDSIIGFNRDITTGTRLIANVSHDNGVTWGANQVVASFDQYAYVVSPPKKFKGKIYQSYYTWPGYGGGQNDRGIGVLQVDPTDLKNPNKIYVAQWTPIQYNESSLFVTNNGDTMVMIIRNDQVEYTNKMYRSWTTDGVTWATPTQVNITGGYKNGFPNTLQMADGRTLLTTRDTTTATYFGGGGLWISSDHGRNFKKILQNKNNYAYLYGAIEYLSGNQYLYTHSREAKGDSAVVYVEVVNVPSIPTLLNGKYIAPGGDQFPTAYTDYIMSQNVNKIVGTPNQVIVSDSINRVKISLPQDIGTTSIPYFKDLHLTGRLYGDDAILGSMYIGHKSQLSNYIITDNSGFNNTGVYQISAFGRSALHNVSGTGYRNLAAFGTSAGKDNTTGYNNNYFGFESGLGITTGWGNTILGTVQNLPFDLSGSVVIANGNYVQRIFIDDIGRTKVYGTLTNKVAVSANDPTTTDIADGYEQTWHNTTTNTTKRWVNIGGTLKSITFN